MRNLKMSITFVALAVFILPFLSGFAGDDTVYRPGEVTLKQVNSNAFKNIIERPYLQKYPGISNCSVTDFLLIDISKICNMGFEDDVHDNNKGGWTDSGAAYDLYPFGPGYGVRKFYGVPFKILDPAKNNGLTMVVMKSGWKTNKHFPDKASVKVGARLSKIFFLQASSWAGTQWGMGADRNYKVVFADGTSLVVPVICAGGHENIGNWMWNPSSGVSLLETSAAKPVPVMIGKDIRYLFTLEWKNPSPEKRIERIEILTANDGKWFTLVTLAITGLKTEK